MKRAHSLFVVIVATFALSFAPAAKAETMADFVGSINGGVFDRADAYESLPGDPVASSTSIVSPETAEEEGVAVQSEDEGITAQSEEEGIATQSEDEGIAVQSEDGELTPQATITPMTLSNEMLYFCKYESSMNYNAGFSSGDNWHAIGFFQFDNRYGLGNFLKACYEYSPTTFKDLKQIGDLYDWNTYGSGGNIKNYYLPGREWSSELQDIEWSWHQAYNANPTLFSQLQNGWAYSSYYTVSRKYLSDTFGINLDKYADSARGMCWGMTNLFGSGGWQRWPNGAGLTTSMNSRQFTSSLANSLISLIGNGTYKYDYGESYANRYAAELYEALSFQRSSVAQLAANSPKPLSNGVYEIALSANPSVVVEVGSGDTSNGANVRTWTSNGTKAQRWRITNAGGGYVYITNVNSGKVLDIAGAALIYSGDINGDGILPRMRGTNVWQYDYNGSDAQLWVPVAYDDGTYTFYSKIGQGIVLDIAGGATGSGGNVSSYADNGSKAQRFIVTEPIDVVADNHKSDLPNGTYQISTTLDGTLAFDIASASTANGANLQIWTSNGTNAQKYRVTHDSNNFITLTNVSSGKVLEVVGSKTTAGTNVAQRTSTGATNQKWVAVKNGDGTYRFLSALGHNLTLDVSGANASPGANIQVYTANYTASQDFSVHTATWNRLGGATALDTMRSVVGQAYGSAKASTVVIASLDGYWDALSASAYAGALGAPVLLTDPKSLSSQTKAQIKSLGATKVVIVGGTAAVSSNVESQLKSLVGTSAVKRVAGQRATLTAVALLKDASSSWGKTCIIASSKTYQDALSIASYAYAKRVPIVLVEDNGSLSSEAAAAIRSCGFTKAIIVGGTAAVPTSVETKLASVGITKANMTRLQGATCYETSAAIATWELKNGMSLNKAAVASGESYYDALSASCLAGRSSSVVVLVSEYNHATASVLAPANASTQLYVLGGTAAVSNSTLLAMMKSAG